MMKELHELRQREAQRLDDERRAEQSRLEVSDFLLARALKTYNIDWLPEKGCFVNCPVGWAKWAKRHPEVIVLQRMEICSDGFFVQRPLQEEED
jgi:hypothetical protein